MASGIHNGDVGTVFEFTVKDEDGVVVDISSQTTMDILFLEPDATTGTKGATFTTDGTDGKMFYTTVADDLDKVGHWKWQASLVLSGGTWKSDRHEFEVHPNIA